MKPFLRSPGLVARLLLPLALPAIPCLCARQVSGAERADTSVPELKRPTWGKVTGWVLDAESHEPVPKARVVVEVGGAFPESGKSTDETDEHGKFSVRAPLGKISSKFDWGRLLSMHPVSLLFSPMVVTKQTRVLDVSRLNVRVEADGYQPFLGSVRAAVTDPGYFSVQLDDVWLARSGSHLCSFTPSNLRMEAIESFKVEPPVAERGEKVRITLAARLPLDRGFKYRAYVTSTSIRLIENGLELKREKAAPPSADADPERVVFSREVKLPLTQDRWTELGFYIERDDDLVFRQRDTRALLQVVRTPEERDAAEKLEQGYLTARAGDKEAALQQYAAASAADPDSALAHFLYGDLCLQLNRPADAAAAYQRLVDVDPRDYRVARPRLAQALFEAGRPDAALATVADAEKTPAAKLRLPPGVALIRARVYASRGDFKEVDKWLAKAGEQSQIPPETLTEINLKRMAAAAKATPNDPAVHLAYARVLHDARRREEALAEIRRACALDPSQPWAFIDLGTGLWQLGLHPEALVELRRALALAPNNVEALIALADAERDEGRWSEALPLYRKAVDQQKLNLRARHNLAIMLYAAGKTDEARRELLEVVTQAREKGDIIDDGLLIPGMSVYFGPKRRLVAGFSVPEAEADQEILEALQDLARRDERSPETALLWQNIGSALLDLHLPRLALPALDRSRQADGSLLETRFLIGMAYRQLGRPDAARAELSAVIAANPLHPRARVELARLYTELGDFEHAQVQLLAHSRNYPHERPVHETQSFGG